MGRLIAIGLAGLALSAALRPAAALEGADYERLDAALTDRVVVAGYRRYARAAAVLAGSVARLCRDPSTEPLAQARADFRGAMDAWQRVQGIAFGPVMEGFGPARIQFWPDKSGTGARQMRAALAAEQAELLVPGALAAKSVALSDLQSLEWLLFDRDPPLLAAGSYRCAFAAAVARYQADLAEDILVAWTAPGGFREEILHAAGGAGAYRDAPEAAREFLESMAGILDGITAAKLERPLGEGSSGARPTRAESWRSRRSLENIVANLETARELFVTEGAFADLLTGVGSGALAIGMTRDFDNAIGAARGIGAPLYDAVGDPVLRPRVEALLAQVRDLRVLVTEIMAPELDLAIGFNASDGD